MDAFETLKQGNLEMEVAAAHIDDAVKGRYETTFWCTLTNEVVQPD